MLVKQDSPLADIILACLLMSEGFWFVASFTMAAIFAEGFTNTRCPKYICKHDFEDKERLYNYATIV